MSSTADVPNSEFQVPSTEPVAAATAERTGGLPFGLGDLAFIVVFAAVIATARGGLLDDPGLGWHIRQVDAMIDQGNWLTTDPFSATHLGWKWYTNQWVGDVLLWAGDRWGGLNGVAAVTALCLAFMYLSLYHMLRADGLPAAVAFVWTLVGAFGSYLAWPARPNILTLWFLLLAVRLCERYHRGLAPPRSLLWLLPLFALWANCHGGFLAGLLSVGVALAVDAGLAVCSLDVDTRRAAGQRARWLAVILPGCLLATLVNPYGWKLYPWVFELLGNRFFMDECNIEWFSPNFHKPGAMRYELLILLFPALMAYGRTRPPLLSVALGVFWLHFALNGQRYVPLWAIIIILPLARASIDLPWLCRLWDKADVSPDLAELLRRPPGRPGWVAPLVVTAAVLGWAKFGKPFAAHLRENMPTKALDLVLEVHPETGPKNLVFHSPDWGGYFIWHGWPRFKPYIDDRNEVQGEAFLKEYLALIAAKPGWQDKLTVVRTVCIPADVPLSYALEQDARWQRIYPRPRQGEPWAEESLHADAVVFQRVEDAVAGR